MGLNILFNTHETQPWFGRVPATMYRKIMLFLKKVYVDVQKRYVSNIDTMIIIWQ